MGGQYRPRKPSTPSRKAPECEVDDPEGNLVIVERVVHENQRCFPDWEHGWVGTAHVLTSTQDDAVEQKEQKEVKYIVPFVFGTNHLKEQFLKTKKARFWPRLFNGGGTRIRTLEGYANRFTVCPV